jgi:CysZ protein
MNHLPPQAPTPVHGGAPPPAAPLAPAPRERPGFGAGVRALFGGFGLIFGDPGLVPLALVPIAVALAATGLLGWAAVAFVPDLVRALLGEHAGGVLSTILEILATAVALIVAALLGFALAQPLSGPALERIVRRVEAKLGAPPWPPTSVIADVLRSLESLVIPYAFGLPILIVLFVINLFFAPAAIVTIPLKLAVTALMVAWDLCDYPLSIRGIPAGTRVSFMKRNAKAMLGFGVGLALVGLIPCLLVLVLPVGVAGGARLVVEIERWEATQRGAPGPGS